MPTFMEWEAMRRRGTAAPLSSSFTPMSAQDVQDVSPETIASAERFLARPMLDLDPTEESDPTGAKLSFTQDPSRYLGHAAKGLARSPLDLVKGLLGLPAQVVRGLLLDLPTLVQDPSLVMELPQEVKNAAEFANTHPGEMGSLLGQSLLAPRVPGAANAVLRGGPSLVGRAMSATGRGAAAAGVVASKTMGSTGGVVPLVTALSGHPWLTAAELAAPPVLKGAGRMMQRGGAALEGLDLSLKGRMPFERVPETPFEETPAGKMRKKVAGAREDVSAGFSRHVASKLNDLKSRATDVSQPAQDVANPGELFPYQRDVIRGLNEARRAGDNAWANDASAQPMPSPMDSRISNLPPEDPGVVRSSPEPDYSNLSPLDRLSRLSQRAPDVQRLIERYGGRGR